MGLALVVVEEHARAAVHLADDDALGAVDDEGALVRHQGHVAHVDVLLLDAADRARPGVLVDVPDHEAQRDLERRGEVHAALLALLDVVFRRLELVAHELELGALGEILDREDRLEDLLEPQRLPLIGGDAHLQEGLVGAHLHFDQVRQRSDLGDAPEALADTLATREGLQHRLPLSSNSARRAGRAMPEKPVLRQPVPACPACAGRSPGRPAGRPREGTPGHRERSGLLT